MCVEIYEMQHTTLVHLHKEMTNDREMDDYSYTWQQTDFRKLLLLQGNEQNENNNWLTCRDFRCAKYIL